MPVRESFYGGSAGGGKSDALLMAALMYADEPAYDALLLRRHFTDLTQPGALMDRAHDWLGGTAAKWNDNDRQWTFPSGARLSFGYLAGPRDHERYQGAAFQFVGFDELTQFPEHQYRYLFSRQRRLEGSQIPLRMMSASNPGSVGHDWVFERLIVNGHPGLDRFFQPAGIDDNAHLDRAEYVRSLEYLDPITREQLLRGVWVLPKGARSFDRAWWRGRNRYDPTDPVMIARAEERIISFDTALKDEEENAYTAWVVGDLVVPDNTLGRRLLLRDAGRDRLQFPDLLQTIENVARRWNQDGKLSDVVIEDKASGTSAYQTLNASAPSWLADRLRTYNPARASKPERWAFAAAWCKLGAVWLPHAHESVPWLGEFEGELFGLPDSPFKDWGDAFAQLVLYLRHILAEGHAARSGDTAAAA